MDICKYGDKCYRKNADHVKKFHTGKDRKRKATDEVSPPETSHSASGAQLEPLAKRQDISAKTDYPVVVTDFWKRVKLLSKDDCPLDDLREDFPFFAADLPEMKTFYSDGKGHYALWRDEPNSEDYLIVHSTNEEHFPEIKLIGNRMEHFLLDLLGKESTVLKSLLPANSSIKDIEKEAKTTVTARRKRKLGNAPNGVGILVPVKNDVGYRPIQEQPANIRKWITSVGTSTNSSLKEKSMDHVNEIFSYVQFANDECDFGMGLEFGHWLWLSNYKELTEMAEKVLATAYRLLERDEYADIVSGAAKLREEGNIG